MARQNSNNRQGMSRQEAGRKGGEATSRSHDSEFYENIGSEGGKNSPGQFEKGSKRAKDAGRAGGEARNS